LSRNADMPPRDRAAVLTTAVIQITSASSIPESEKLLHVENLLRDELDAARREAIADRDFDPDA
jgi:hypothetical protein